MIRSLALSLILTASGALAEGTVSAAGQLDHVTSEGSCSAVLIREDLIATAAHCVVRRRIAFRPGDGQNGESYLVAKFVPHPLFEATERIDWKLRFDVAIGRLARPVPLNRAVPIPLGEDAEVGERLFIVSWRNDGTDRPRQRACPVIAGVPGLVTLGCQVRGGESGAPVFRKTEDGLELVAIVSSRAKLLNQPVAYASNVRLRLQPMIDKLDATSP